MTLACDRVGIGGLAEPLIHAAPKRASSYVREVIGATMNENDKLSAPIPDQQQHTPSPQPEAPPNSGTNLPDPNPQWLDEAQLPSNYEKREE